MTDTAIRSAKRRMVSNGSAIDAQQRNDTTKYESAGHRASAGSRLPMASGRKYYNLLRPPHSFPTGGQRSFSFPGLSANARTDNPAQYQNVVILQNVSKSLSGQYQCNSGWPVFVLMKDSSKKESGIHCIDYPSMVKWLSNYSEAHQFAVDMLTDRGSIKETDLSHLRRKSGVFYDICGRLSGETIHDFIKVFGIPDVSNVNKKRDHAGYIMSNHTKIGIGHKGRRFVSNIFDINVPASQVLTGRQSGVVRTGKNIYSSSTQRNSVRRLLQVGDEVGFVFIEGTRSVASDPHTNMFYNENTTPEHFCTILPAVRSGNGNILFDETVIPVDVSPIVSYIVSEKGRMDVDVDMRFVNKSKDSVVQMLSAPKFLRLGIAENVSRQGTRETHIVRIVD